VQGEVNIGVSSHGLSVYKERLVIYRWPWQKIIDFSYGRGGFTIKVRPKVRLQRYLLSVRVLNLEVSGISPNLFWRANDGEVKGPSKVRTGGTTMVLEGCHQKVFEILHAILYILVLFYMG